MRFVGQTATEALLLVLDYMSLRVGFLSRGIQSLHVKQRHAIRNFPSTHIPYVVQVHPMSWGHTSYGHVACGWFLCYQMTEGLVVLINFFTVAIALHLLAVKYVKTTGGEFKLIVCAFTWRPAGWFCTFNGQHDIRVVFAKHQTKEGEFELRGITTWAKRMAFLLQGKATSSWFVLTIGFGNSGTCVLHPKTMQTNYPFADRIVLSLDLTDGNSLSVLAMPGDWKYVRVHMVKVGSPLAEHINQAEGQAEGYAWSRVVPTHIWDTDYGNWGYTKKILENKGRCVLTQPAMHLFDQMLHWSNTYPHRRCRMQSDAVIDLVGESANKQARYFHGIGVHMASEALNMYLECVWVSQLARASKLGTVTADTVPWAGTESPAFRPFPSFTHAMLMHACILTWTMCELAVASVTGFQPWHYNAQHASADRKGAHMMEAYRHMKNGICLVKRPVSTNVMYTTDTGSEKTQTREDKVWMRKAFIPQLWDETAGGDGGALAAGDGGALAAGDGGALAAGDGAAQAAADGHETPRRPRQELGERGYARSCSEEGFVAGVKGTQWGPYITNSGRPKQGASFDDGRVLVGIHEWFSTTDQGKLPPVDPMENELPEMCHKITYVAKDFLQNASCFQDDDAPTFNKMFGAAFQAASGQRAAGSEVPVAAGSEDWFVLWHDLQVELVTAQFVDAHDVANNLNFNRDQVEKGYSGFQSRRFKNLISDLDLRHALETVGRVAPLEQFLHKSLEQILHARAPTSPLPIQVDNLDRILEVTYQRRIDSAPGIVPKHRLDLLNVQAAPSLSTKCTFTDVKEYLQRAGLVLQDVPADGNCWLHVFEDILPNCMVEVEAATAKKGKKSKPKGKPQLVLNESDLRTRMLTELNGFPSRYEFEEDRKKELQAQLLALGTLSESEYFLILANMVRRVIQVYMMYTPTVTYPDNFHMPPFSMAFYCPDPEVELLEREPHRLLFLIPLSDQEGKVVDGHYMKIQTSSSYNASLGDLEPLVSAHAAPIQQGSIESESPMKQPVKMKDVWTWLHPTISEYLLSLRMKRKGATWSVDSNKRGKQGAGAGRALSAGPGGALAAGDSGARDGTSRVLAAGAGGATTGGDRGALAAGDGGALAPAVSIDMTMTSPRAVQPAPAAQAPGAGGVQAARPRQPALGVHTPEGVFTLNEWLPTKHVEGYLEAVGDVTQCPSVDLKELLHSLNSKGGNCRSILTRMCRVLVEHGYATIPVCNNKHWWLLCFEYLSKPASPPIRVYVYDSLWEKNKPNLTRLLVSLQQVCFFAPREFFPNELTVEVIDMQRRHQHDGYQCGVWVAIIGDLWIQWTKQPGEERPPWIQWVDTHYPCGDSRNSRNNAAVAYRMHMQAVLAGEC